jgi:hypothetical protein
MDSLCDSLVNSFVFNPFDQTDFLNEPIHSTSDSIEEFVRQLRHLYVSSFERMIQHETEEKNKPKVADQLFETERRYVLVMYNVHSVRGNYFSVPESTDPELEDDIEFSYWEPKAIGSNYKWKHVMGSRKEKTIRLQEDEYDDEKKRRGPGRPKKKPSEKKYQQKYEKKGRPRGSTNKSKLKKWKDQDESQIQLSPKKLAKLLQKPFKPKVFKNKEYKIKKVEWKRRIKSIDLLLMRLKL